MILSLQVNNMDNNNEKKKKKNFQTNTQKGLLHSLKNWRNNMIKYWRSTWGETSREKVLLHVNTFQIISVEMKVSVLTVQEKLAEVVLRGRVGESRLPQASG